MTTITTHNGNGVEINKVWSNWLKIKTKKQHDKWSLHVGTLRFGTYNNLTILDVIPNFEPQYPNSILERDFLMELKNAINKHSNN